MKIKHFPIDGKAAIVAKRVKADKESGNGIDIIDARIRIMQTLSEKSAASLEKASKDAALLVASMEKPKNKGNVALKKTLKEQQRLVEKKIKILQGYADIMVELNEDLKFQKAWDHLAHDEITEMMARIRHIIEDLPDWSPSESGYPTKATTSTTGILPKIYIHPATKKKPSVPS